MKRHLHLLLAASLAIGLAGCAGMTTSQQRTLSGTTMGAAGGAVIGAIAGNAGLGAGIGAARSRRHDEEFAGTRLGA